jgi:hypothetical protein
VPNVAARHDCAFEEIQTMTAKRTAATQVLQIIASLCALGPMLGTLVTVCQMMATLQAVGPHVDTKHVALDISVTMYAVWGGLVLFPVGVGLHWIIAKRTGGMPSSARQALFWGSLFACLDCSLGAMMGVATICLLFVSPSFKRRPAPPLPESSEKP